MDNNFEKPNRLDELEKKLYSPTHGVVQKERRHLRPQEYDVPQDWQPDQGATPPTFPVEGEKKTNWFLGFFILAFIFFLGALGYVGFKFYFSSGINAQNVDILINAPLTIGAGETFDFEVALQNKNQIAMRLVDIEVQFPDGTRSVTDIGTDYKKTKETIESIAIGEVVKKNYSALLFGEEGDKKEVSVFLMYQVEGSTTLFKKEKKFDVVLKSTPVRLTITNVKEITAGQDLAFTIELVSNSTQTLKNVMVQATYPFGFLYKSSTLAPKSDKKSWVIQTLAPKETVTFTVKGTIEGQNKDDKYFTFSVGLEDPEKESPQVVFSTKGTTISLERPFLELGLEINQNSSDTIALDPEIGNNASVSFKNNTEFPLRNASISLLIDGASLRKDSIQVSEGFYQSLDNRITWDNTTADELVSIPVGTSGDVFFNFTGLGVASEQFIINPEVTFSIQVKGNRNPVDQVSEMIENSIVKKIRFNTQLSINAISEYYSSTFANTGPIPPKVEQKTTYTSVISIKNSTSVVSNGVVTMRIPNYVQYEGVFSPSSEQVSYDPVTRLIVWNVGTVGTKVGYAGNKPRTLALQVSLIPSVSQTGNAPTLIESIVFEGTDTHTQQKVSESALSVSTQIKDAKDYYSAQVSR